MDWSELIPTIIKTPITVYKNRKIIQHWWIKLLAQVDYGDTDIVILGRPSVGKTILSKCLHGQAPKFNYKTPDTSPSIETEALNFGDWTKLVRVIPGQTDNKQRDIGIEEAFHKSKSLEGVIYVVDWGYSEPRDLTLKSSLIIDKGLDTIEKIRDYNLKNEIEDIKSVCEQIKVAYSNGKAPKWIIIAVNKVDLFYDRINNAQRYYSINYQSQFADEINKLINSIGALNIKCRTNPMCVWQKDFEWNGQIQKTNLGGKDIEFGLSLNFISSIAKMSK